MIDLRSDTLTRPTPAMRAAMAAAEVGDDVYGEDPTVRALERRTAEILGKEAALFVPSGTMGNQVALRAHTEPGDEVLTEAGSHVANYERGGPAALSGVTLRLIQGAGDGLIDADQLRGALRRPGRYGIADMVPPQRLLVVEDTHNAGGGTVWPLAQLREVAAVGRDHGMRVHLDGARLWNAAAASGVPEGVIAAEADTVNVCFSKGLGAPVGSALAGPAPFVARARRFRGMYGGAMRQAGVLAAAALHALDHHRTRLAEDHARARAFAEALAGLPGVEVDPARVATNIVAFRLRGGAAAVDLVERCWERGVRMLPVGPDRVRAVFHLDLPEDAAPRAAAAVAEALRLG
jgi:threonine aldolase